MRISDWSSYVCSSDLRPEDAMSDGVFLDPAQALVVDDIITALGRRTSELFHEGVQVRLTDRHQPERVEIVDDLAALRAVSVLGAVDDHLQQVRKSDVSGKSVSGREDLGGVRKI